MSRRCVLGPTCHLALPALLLAGGCGGDATEASSSGVSAETPRSVVEERPPAAFSPANDAAATSRSEPSPRQEAPVLTEPPDACELLTRADAGELLGAPVGPGRSADVTGIGNCAYRTESGEQLSLLVQLGGDDRVESTQFAMSFEHCGTEVSAPSVDVGVASNLFRRPSEPCGSALVLWVATGRRFDGRPHPDLARTVSGRIHLLLSWSPAPSPGDASPLLRAAAERALARLEQ